MVRPEVRPCRDCSTRTTGCSARSAALTPEMAPVTTLFFCVPYPTTMTSSSLDAAVCSSWTEIEPEAGMAISWRSEEHTSELQSHSDLVCRLLLEKKKL